MEEDKKSREQAKFIKTQATNILDLLVKIGPVSHTVKEGYSVGRETQKVLSIFGRETDKIMSGTGTGHLTSTDGNINRLAEIASQLSNELSRLNRFDEQWWIDTSGANLFNPKDSMNALESLQKQRQHLLALKEACEGLKVLAEVAFANTVANVKGLAKMYMPSLPMIDRAVTDETRRKFDVCIGLLDSMLKKVEAAIRAVADMNSLVDQFLVLKYSQDQRAAVKSIRQGGNKNP